MRYCTISQLLTPKLDGIDWKQGQSADLYTRRVTVAVLLLRTDESRDVGGLGESSISPSDL